MNCVREARRQPCHPEPVRKNASAVAQEFTNACITAEEQRSSAAITSIRVWRSSGSSRRFLLPVPATQRAAP